MPMISLEMPRTQNIMHKWLSRLTFQKKYCFRMFKCLADFSFDILRQNPNKVDFTFIQQYSKVNIKWNYLQIFVSVPNLESLGLDGKSEKFKEIIRDFFRKGKIKHAFEFGRKFRVSLLLVSIEIYILVLENKFEF